MVISSLRRLLPATTLPVTLYLTGVLDHTGGLMLSMLQASGSEGFEGLLTPIYYSRSQKVGTFSYPHAQNVMYKGF